MKRHASADQLADLAVGALRPRKAGRIAAHLAGCAHCTDVSDQLTGVSSMLASVPFAPMPAQLSSRIEATLAAESVQRLASEPATEAGRRDLPARGRHSSPTGQGRRILGLSGPASRLVAAAGALVIIGAGGYEIAAHVNTGASTPGTASAGSAHVPASQLSLGPSVKYHQDSTGATKSLPTVRSDTNFTSANLGTKAVASMTAARQQGAVPNAGSGGTARAPSFSSAHPAPTANSADSTAKRSQDQLTGCVDKIAAGQTVLLVELAKYDGKNATIILVAAVKPAGSAEAWAVSPSCSAADTHILDHVHVAHI